MKKMLIASAAVGATIAGLILYKRRKGDRIEVTNGNKSARKLKDGVGKADWNPVHSMG